MALGWANYSGVGAQSLYIFGLNEQGLLTGRDPNIPFFDGLNYFDEFTPRIDRFGQLIVKIDFYKSLDYVPLFTLKNDFSKVRVDMQTQSRVCVFTR